MPRPKELINKRLPAKLSDVILKAIKDLEVVEKMPEDYVILMDDYFHSPLSDSGREVFNTKAKCAVCLAGAVMAANLGTNINDDLDPMDFINTTRYKLEALDDIRLGYVKCALVENNFISENRFEEYRKKGLKETYRVESYNNNPKKFKSDMRKIAKRLKDFGL